MRARISRYVLGVLLLVPLFFAPGAQPQAAMVQTDGLGATGILGLSVGTQTFNIDFVGGFYDTVFPGGEVFPNAPSIVDEIVIELNNASSPTISPASALRIHEFFVPGQTSATTVDASKAGCGFFNAFLGPCLSTWLNQGDPILVRDEERTWAVPTVVSPVPLPAARPLFGSALAMLGIVGWRRRRQAGA